MSDAIDYDLKSEQVSDLLGASQLPADIRKALLLKYAYGHGTEALAELFAQFIGLANSVAANNREMIELYLITEAAHYPQTAEKINLPTIFGALNGVKLADGIDQSALCHGCAFRHGSVANQSPATTCDADWCAHPGERPFFCHEGVAEDGEPTRGCAGFAQMRRRRKEREYV